MTQDRHEHVMEIFNAAAELSPQDRLEFLKTACGGDAALQEDVESLLAHDGAEMAALDSPILGTGFNVTQAVDPDLAIQGDLPERIGPYRIVGVLGAGSMGVVYRAQQESPARAVALKVMHPGRISRSLQRRFQAEAASLGRLRHPGIAQIYDAGTEQTRHGPRPYISMELVEGLPLMAYVQARALGPDARLGLLARVCDAVQHAHQHGVIHRDLKPANILVEDGDDGPQPRILDFGVARITDLDVRTATLATEQGQLVGTLAYMSPEQVDANPDEIDTRSDVYALGVIGYELLCGQLPIEVSRMSVFAALQAIREQPPQPLAIHDRKFRGDLSTLLNKALAKDKNQRYESAGMLATDIRNYLAHRPITARKPSLVYVARKFAARHRVLVVAAALVVILLIAAISGTTYGLLRARESGERLRAQVHNTSVTANYLVQEVVKNLDAISGTAEVRQGMLDRLEREVGGLLKQSPGDPVLLKARAMILSQRSDLLASAGHRERALELRLASLEFFEALAAAHPADAERQADLSIAMVKVGDICLGNRDAAAARQWYERAYEIDRHLAAAQPDSIRFLDNLAWSYDRLANLAMDDRRMEEAKDLLMERLRTNERLLALAPDRLTNLYGIWESHDLLARLADEQDDPAESQRQLIASLEAARRVKDREPQQRDFAMALAIAQLRFGSHPCVEHSAATAALDEAVVAFRKFHFQDPQDERALMLLRWALHARGDLAVKSDEAAVALRMYEEVLELANERGADPASILNDEAGTQRAAEAIAKIRARIAGDTISPPSSQPDR